MLKFFYVMGKAVSDELSCMQTGLVLPVDLSILIIWMSPFLVLGAYGRFFFIFPVFSIEISLTLLHSERPKLHTVLAFQSAVRLSQRCSP